MAVPLDVRMALLRQYGSFTQAYSATVQQGLEHFGDALGFLAYKTVGRTAMVLADPIAPTVLVSDLIDRFLREYSDIAFWQISRPIAQLLATKGFLINELGYETRLDLATYSFDGQRRRNLRKASHRMAKLGYTIRECALSALDIREVEAVSRAWRRTRTFRNHEVGFLNRPISFDEEPDVRRFFAFDRNGQLVALCFCDPLYEAGAVVGYSTSNVRFHPKVDSMIGYALKRHAIETLQREGKRWLTLGLSPADGIKDNEFAFDRRLRRGLRFAYDNALFNRFVYPLQGHAAHKRQFDGIAEQTYVATNKRPGLWRLLKLLRACDII